MLLSNTSIIRFISLVAPNRRNTRRIRTIRSASNEDALTKSVSGIYPAITSVKSRTFQPLEKKDFGELQAINRRQISIVKTYKIRSWIKVVSEVVWYVSIPINIELNMITPVIANSNHFFDMRFCDAYFRIMECLERFLEKNFETE